MNDTRRPLTPCRLIVDAGASGAWQMAVDEVLLETAAGGGGPSLRFYGWSEPTLSLGYFQRFEDARRHPPSRDCPRVRRQTGGGAILHDHELTYSLALPETHRLAVRATQLYEAVHEALRRALDDFGIAAALRADDDEGRTGGEPFLCFQRRTRYDVLVGTTKVCGSAQRRRRGAILQHGSLLLAQSSKAPELPGIRELAGKEVERESFVESWGAQLSAGLGLALFAAPLAVAELDAVRRLAIEKYGTARWNERR